MQFILTEGRIGPMAMDITSNGESIDKRRKRL
jgi:hypothetical protein